MGVEGFIAVGMLEPDHVAIGSIAPGKGDRAIAGGFDGSSGRRTEIYAHMHFRITEQGMFAHAEARGEAGARDRRLGERFGGAAALLIEIVGMAVIGRGETVVGLIAPGVIERGI